MLINYDKRLASMCLGINKIISSVIAFIFWISITVGELSNRAHCTLGVRIVLCITMYRLAVGPT